MKKLIIFLLISLLLALSLTSCIDEDIVSVQWTASEDSNEISDGTTVYKRYKDLPLDFSFASGVKYDKRVSLYDFNAYIYSNSLESGIKYCSYGGGLTAYVAEGTDTTELDSFLSRIPKSVKIYSGDNGYVNLDPVEAEKLDALTENPLTVEVRALKSAGKMTVYYFNADDSLYYPHGAIYEYESKHYYINYDVLDNSYFDANGDFAYLRGSVTMFPLENEHANRLTNLQNESDDSYWHETESDRDLLNEMEQISVKEAKRTIAFCLVAVNIIPSVSLFCYGLFDYIKKKSKKNIYAYIIMASSLIWLICGIAIMAMSL